MTARRRLVVEADGGSRGNPGVAGYGAVVRDAATSTLLVEVAEPLGVASNNVAEYRGLIAGLEEALGVEPGADVEARLDSKLVVEQMSGRWKIKHEAMRELALRAREVCEEISAAGGSVSFRWVPREQNKAADALSNDAMDGRSIRRIHAAVADTGDTPTDAGTATPTSAPTRILLVQALGDDQGEHRIAGTVGRLVAGTDLRLHSGTDRSSEHLATMIGGPLDVEPQHEDDWTAPMTADGPDARAREAYARLLATGGTHVVVTSRRGVLTVLSEVLALAADRFWSIATAPGSLTAVEVWPDGSAAVAFTNRTDHLS